jgi:hypothetical protein
MTDFSTKKCTLKDHKNSLKKKRIIWENVSDVIKLAMERYAEVQQTSTF